MAGPGIVVIAGTITAYLAVVSNDGLVVDDYYKQGLAVNQVMERNQRAEQIGLQAELLRSDDGSQLRVFLQAREVAVFPQALRLLVTHPTRNGVDQDVVLSSDGAGSYSGKLSVPLSGRWHVVLEDDKSEWRLTGDWIVDKQSALQLPGLARAAGRIDLHPDAGKSQDSLPPASTEYPFVMSGVQPGVVIRRESSGSRLTRNSIWSARIRRLRRIRPS